MGLLHILSLFYKQTECCAQMETKGRLMGEARRNRVDQGAMWERWNLPKILLRPPPGREMSDLQNWQFSWETWRLWRTHMETFTHICWEKRKTWNTNTSRTHTTCTIPENSRLWHTIDTHTQAYSNMYGHTHMSSKSCVVAGIQMYDYANAPTHTFNTRTHTFTNNVRCAWFTL